jgi:hypothetical protein
MTCCQNALGNALETITVNFILLLLIMELELAACEILYRNPALLATLSNETFECPAFLKP